MSSDVDRIGYFFRTLIAGAMAWGVLGGGADALPTASIHQGVSQLLRPQATYVSKWDGSRIPAQAMRQVW